MTDQLGADLSDKIGANLPFLRRYARALTGSRQHGDQYAILTLETILADPTVFDGSVSDKAGLLKVFQSI